uniref:BBSome-interacting protein 1 n=1 Tax=Meloidogyne javanica TaxID=6303 RepID=A0A915LI78_MELJA
MTENSPNNYQQPQQQEPKELLWPPSGYVFEQESLLPAYCKPKICPLKSVTLEKLEKMQEEANRRMRELEEKERKEINENEEGNN